MEPTRRRGCLRELPVSQGAGRHARSCQSCCDLGSASHLLGDPMGVPHPARDKPGAPVPGPVLSSLWLLPPPSLPCLRACPPAVACLQRSLLAPLCTPKHPCAPLVSSPCKHHPSLWAPDCSWEAALGRSPRRLPLTPRRPSLRQWSSRAFPSPDGVQRGAQDHVCSFLVRGRRPRHRLLHG